MVLGLRPEHISVRRRDGKGRGNAVLKAKVEVIEPMGNEFYIHCSAGPSDGQLIARINSLEKLIVGKSVDLLFDMSKAHFFDNETQKAI